MTANFSKYDMMEFGNSDHIQHQELQEIISFLLVFFLNCVFVDLYWLQSRASRVIRASYFRIRWLSHVKDIIVQRLGWPLARRLPACEKYESALRTNQPVSWKRKLYSREPVSKRMRGGSLIHRDWCGEIGLERETPKLQDSKWAKRVCMSGSVSLVGTMAGNRLQIYRRLSDATMNDDETRVFAYVIRFDRKKKFHTILS